jgi:hypothetical protein
MVDQHEDFRGPGSAEMTQLPEAPVMHPGELTDDDLESVVGGLAWSPGERLQAGQAQGS